MPKEEWEVIFVKGADAGGSLLNDGYEVMYPEWGKRLTCVACDSPNEMQNSFCKPCIEDFDDEYASED